MLSSVGVFCYSVPMIFGTLLIIIGALALMENLNLIVLPNGLWSVAWPLFFIVLGAYMMIGIRKTRHYRAWFAEKAARYKERHDQSFS